MDIEYKLPENPNEVYPFELYPEIFTYETIDPEKCKQISVSIHAFTQIFNKKCLQTPSVKKKSFSSVT